MTGILALLVGLALLVVGHVNRRSSSPLVLGLFMLGIPVLVTGLLLPVLGAYAPGAALVLSGAAFGAVMLSLDGTGMASAVGQVLGLLLGLCIAIVGLGLLGVVGLLKHLF